MYIVLYQAEMRLFFPDTAKGVFVCLAFQGQKRTKPLLMSLAKNIDDKRRDEAKFELAAKLLNRSRPLQVQKLRLRFINAVVRQQIEEMSFAPLPFSVEAFDPSYGRID